jgi:hypothetical protein
LRSAKVARKAESQQKQRLRRHEFDEDLLDANAEPEPFLYGDSDAEEEDDEK